MKRLTPKEYAQVKADTAQCANIQALFDEFSAWKDHREQADSLIDELHRYALACLRNSSIYADAGLSDEAAHEHLFAKHCFLLELYVTRNHHNKR